MRLTHAPSDLPLRVLALEFAVVPGIDSQRGLSESVDQYSGIGQITSPVPKSAPWQILRLGPEVLQNTKDAIRSILICILIC